MTKEISFLDPLAHPPKEAQYRWWKVRTIINIIEIPRPADSQPARYPDESELDADPANTPRRHDLAVLNQWRNVAAHQGTTLPPGGPLTLASLQVWRVSCDGLATALDGIMYNPLRRILRRKPW